MISSLSIHRQCFSRRRSFSGETPPPAALSGEACYLTKQSTCTHLSATCVAAASASPHSTCEGSSGSTILWWLRRGAKNPDSTLLKTFKTEYMWNLKLNWKTAQWLFLFYPSLSPWLSFATAKTYFISSAKQCNYIFPCFSSLSCLWSESTNLLDRALQVWPCFPMHVWSGRVGRGE